MNKKKWVNKQWFRYKQAWHFLQPPLDVLVKLAWLITTVAVTGWFIITLDLAVLSFLFLNVFIWSVGFVGDKTKFWQEWGARNFKMTNTELQFHAWEVQAAMIALPILKALDLDTADVEQTIVDEKKWFEKTSEGHK